MSASSFPCLLCGATVFSASGMQRHIELFHGGGSQGLWESQPESQYACIFCEFGSPSEIELQAHIDKEHSEQYACPLCGLTFGSADGVMIHMSESHPDEGNTPKSAGSCRSEADTKAHVRDGGASDIGGPDVSEADLGDSVQPGSLETDGALEKVSVCEMNGSAGAPEILETSLRLNDCPYSGKDEDLEEEDICDDLVEVDQQQVEDVECGTSDEESNLAEILSHSMNKKASDKSITPASQSTSVHPMNENGRSSQNEKHVDTSGAPVTEGTPIQPTEEHHVGARPKVKVNASPISPKEKDMERPQKEVGKAAGVTSFFNVDNKIYNRTDALEMRDPEDTFTEPDMGYNCPMCSFHTLSEGEIQHHVTHEHMMEEGEESFASDGTLMFLYTCPFCGCGFDTPNDLSRHINTDHPEGEVGGGSSFQDRSAFAGDLGTVAVAEGEGQRMACLQCPVCGVVLTEGNTDTLSAHVSEHFQSAVASQGDTESDRQMAMRLQEQEQRAQEKENQRFQQIQTQYGMDTTMTAKQQFEKDLDQAVSRGQLTVSEYHQKKITQAQSSRSGEDDASTQVPGVLEQLRRFYDSRACPRTVAKAYLSNSTNHYSGSYGDRGWGCGYRNFQMLLSCLMNEPMYLRVLFNGQSRMPSIQKLQQLIETAWQKGFDPQGCLQLGGKVLNTRKWIGTTEIVATLSSLRIKCQVLDFGMPSGPNSTHPALMEWVRDYYKSPQSFKPPLYLQHQGHSRTIVGVEELRNGNINLLLFDPGVPKGRMQQFHGNINYNLLQTMRKTANAFRAKQYQIVAVTGVMTDYEFQRSKTIRSTRMS